MVKKCLIIFILCIGTVVSVAYAGVLPPKEFYVYNRAPWEKGEEVGFGYNLLTNMDIYAAPRSNEKVGCMITGEPVQVIRTVAITHPRLYPVRLYRELKDMEVVVAEGDDTINFARRLQKQSITIPAGATIYLLMYSGEGCYMGWYNNYIINFVSSFNIKNFPSLYGAEEPYLGEYIGHSPVEWEYWVKYRKADGTNGWGMYNREKLIIDYGRYEKVVE